jgi:RNA polymerase sigma-70 factor, ECF subfamily
MPDYPESEIIRKAVSGDRNAFRSLVEKHQAFVYAVACRFLSTKGDAEDVTQETFIRLWKNISKYRADNKLTTWLYKIVSNLCLDHLKSRRKIDSASNALDKHEYTLAAPAQADDPLLKEEFAKLVTQVSEALTPKQKAVFILRDLEDLEVSEVCEILGMSAGNVKSNLYYARLKISKLLELSYAERKTQTL